MGGHLLSKADLRRPVSRAPVARLALLLLSLISACAPLIGYPTDPTDTQALADQQLVADYYSSTNDLQRQQLRNEIVSGRMNAYESAYSNFKRRLNGDANTLNLGADLSVLGLAGGGRYNRQYRNGHSPGGSECRNHRRQGRDQFGSLLPAHFAGIACTDGCQSRACQTPDRHRPHEVGSRLSVGDRINRSRRAARRGRDPVCDRRTDATSGSREGICREIAFRFWV